MSAPRELTVVLIGNPNTGKSTLFTALSGMHTRIANFPGCTVEKKLGIYQDEGVKITLVDLPGTYSLSPRSLDEMVSVDVLLGGNRMSERLTRSSALSTPRTSSGTCTYTHKSARSAFRSCSA